METIRPYRPEDRDRIRHICLVNAGNPRTKKQQRFILATYCDYYLEYEPDNCFVAADDADEAIGYIYCAENHVLFAKRFEEVFLPRAADLGEAKQKAARDSYAAHRRFAAEFPAHMHIDILADYQRKGLGSRLVDTLAENLRAKGIPGLMLTVGAGNIKGINFYKKYGFEELERKAGDVAMGLRL